MKRHETVAACLFRSRSHAPLSFFSVLSSGMRRLRHCRESAESSISTWLSRSDVVVFVNGLPLGLMKLKNPTDENVTLRGAYNQLQTYKSGRCS